MNAKPRTAPPAAIPLHSPLLRGERRPRVALVGRPRTGKSTIFQAASSVAVRHERLAGVGSAYEECIVDVGLEQVSLVNLPSIGSLHRLSEADRVVLMYLLWGDRWPVIARHESEQPTAAFDAPDVLVQVVDATALEQDLELAQELSLLGRPLVIALNRVDEAREKGLFINVRALSERLGVPVVPCVAHMGKGIRALFEVVLSAARKKVCPLPHPPSPHIVESLRVLDAVIARPEIEEAFRVPRPLLLTQLAENDDWFLREIEAHFPAALPEVAAARAVAQRVLPRPLSEELHADRHHRAALLFESVSCLSGPEDAERWKRWLDELFLHPRWGLIGSLAVFALVLFMVFEVAAVLDGLTSARLAAWAGQWQPTSTAGVVGRAVADGMIGLVGIVVPYMLPLVVLLVALEEAGIMHRVAFVVDRGFHRIGLHGGAAVPFLMGLGCNVPAISAAAAATTGRDRVVAALLITFVPCSARSAILLALGGKYLGGLGVFAIFMLILVVIALLGRLLARRYAEAAPGMIQEIPPYAIPAWGALWRNTWARTRDIVTIVTPLLVAGSVALALLSHMGADAVINTLLTPVTTWWLGLPVVLGMPILFGILRKELSLLMVYQALGTLDIAPLLDWVQIVTFLVFLTFYIPCLSTFAVMLKTIGRREALFSVSLSVGVALAVAGATRLLLEVTRGAAA
ncbi:MAG: ferrous iron transporter B [Candidatus Nitricoxidivorans perseverans]|uniref:Ferrous iron transport protein B n=1 Tax=Candidatus Nitricoxidivorans perseverans TaxID=2975601 RepID=A0AA49IXQ8_9PROT|nr:MAG: ferrous iron transporter B [Candidatus Nitricoxidivorans perseverans]